MYSMQYLTKVFANMRDFYYEINPATLTGAIDVVVVEQPDGSFTCSPFHVRFGKLGVLRSRLKVVDLELNGEPLNIHMKLGESGEAFFVEEIPEDEMEASAHLATSPIPESGFLHDSNQDIASIPRRNSADTFEKYQNQVSNFSQRRHTDGQSTQKPDLSSQKREYQLMKDNMCDFIPSSNSGEHQDTMFTMDGLDDETSTVTATGAAKMFKAEEVNDKDSHAKEVVRKISINNDFKPISLVNEPNLSPTAESKLNADDIKENTLEETPKLSSNGSKKKKKTKKGGNKKKNQRKSSNSSSNGYSSQSEAIVPESDEIDKTGNERLSTDQMEHEDPSPTPGYNTKNIIQDMHFFSDTDIGCDNKRQDGTPVQSDSELELARGSGTTVQDTNVGRTSQSWRWGELPSPPPQQSSNSSSDSQGQLSQTDIKNKCESESTTSLTNQGSSSMLSGMFKFIKQGRSNTSQNTVEAEGRYLADLAAVDPEVAALYFPQHTQGHASSQTDVMNVNNHIPNEDDYESGNGPSLPQSPSSVDGPMGKGIDSDEDDVKIFCKGYVGLSLCGQSALQQPLNTLTEAFEQEAIGYDSLCNDPSVLQNPRLVVRIGDQYMPWTTAAPILISLLVFHRPLPKNVIQKSLPATVDAKMESKSEQSGSSTDASGKAQQNRYSWWYWRRSNDKQNSDSIKPEHGDIEGGDMLSSEPSTTYIEEKLILQDIITQESEKTGEDILPKNECESPQEVSTQTSFPLLSAAGGGYSGSQSSEDSDEGGITTTSNMGGISQGGQSKSSTDRFRKTLRLSSEQIASLNLRKGMNEFMFSVTTAYQGTSKCKCHVFRWRYDDKIVISDIDGTITKSDVLGHIFPMVGKDWAQSGVAQLFTKIKNNGYKILYLSARAIGQAGVTREYLRSIRQGDLSLPDGPLLLNPTSLLRAFHREVIEKKPEEFKIQCLSDIIALFPEGSKPFYAGYGNRSNDVCAYQTVGIPIVRIFTINHKGELKHELTQTFQSSYSNMSYIVDHLFPPVRGEVCEDFSQFNYWRQPVETLPELLPTPSTPSTSGLPPIPESASD